MARLARAHPVRLLARSFIVLAALASATHGAECSAQGWLPDRGVELIVPGSAGGGLDRTARVVQKVIQEEKLVTVPVTVVNKAGGGGAVGHSYLQQRAGRGEYLEVASTSLLTNHINGTSQFSHTTFTPIALVSSEYLAIIVRPDSALGDVKKLLSQLQRDPASVAFGIASARGNHQHIAVTMIGKAAGLDAKKLKIVVFNASTDAMTALLGGHIQASTSTIGNLVGHVQAGRVRALAVAAPKRAGGSFANVPTLKESGVNAVVDSWRGFIGPPGMTPQQIALWDTVFSAVSRSDVMKKEAEATLQESNYMNSTRMKQFLNEQYAEFKQSLDEMGIAR